MSILQKYKVRYNSDINMQIVRSKNQFVEKILRDKQGRLVRARFCVYENAGRIKARLLEATVINELVGQVLSLFSPVKKSSQEISFSKSIVSPYFSKNVLNFLGNKPRAPANSL